MALDQVLIISGQNDSRNVTGCCKWQLHEKYNRMSSLSVTKENVCRTFIKIVYLKSTLPQTQLFSSLYLCNLTVKAFDFSNLDYLTYRIYSWKYQRSTTFGCNDLGIRFCDKTFYDAYLFNKKSNSIFKILI